MNNLKFFIGLIIIIGSTSGFCAPTPTLSLRSITLPPGGTGNIDLLVTGADMACAGINAKVCLPDGVALNHVSRGALVPDGFVLAHQTLSGDENGVIVAAYTGAASFDFSAGVLFTLNVTVGQTMAEGVYDVVFGENINPLVNARYAVSNADGSRSVNTAVLHHGRLTVDSRGETCLPLADDLGIWVSGVDYHDLPCCSFHLDFHAIDSDPAGLYWKLNMASLQIEASTDPRIILGDDLGLTFACAEYAGIRFGFKLRFFINENDPSGFYWTLIPESLTVK